MLKNHYGVYVDSDKPIVGVINNSDISQLISDKLYDSIDLKYEEHVKECPDYLENEECNCNLETGTLLIGGWKKNNEGKYEPDETSEYSLIVGEIYTQVAHSKETKRCALCSPCFPGQGDLDSDGDFLTYSIETDIEAEQG